MLVFTEPRAQNAVAPVAAAPKAWVSAAISIGSPSGGAGAVRLDVADRCRRRRRPRACAAAMTSRLALDARRRVADLARAVVVDRRAPDHGADRVAVGAARRPAA